MKSLTILIPSYKTPEYIKLIICSALSFKPDWLDVKFIVVENSDLNYEDFLLEHTGNLVFLNNPTKAILSEANSAGIEMGKSHVDTDYTFVCHSDTCITSSTFFTDFFDKVDEGFDLVGTYVDQHPERIKALHVSGLMIKSSLLREINSSPQGSGIGRLDVGDAYTKYFRDNNKKYFSFRNTHEKPSLFAKTNEPFRSWGRDCGVCRCMGETGDVIFLHLGRGTPKHQKTYQKSGKKTYSEEK